ncbi:MAG: 2-hydroxychromene-2-carboxylate isomerase [Burkholderiales bacterium]|nr:2-hydroxychromene-2-carboxylate isomerase [Burkholderiales bacterium]
MPSKTVEFFHDYASPASYLAWAQLPALCAKHGATFTSRPMLLGGVFKAAGNQTPVNIPAKGRWLLADLQRHADAAGVPFRLNPHFIFNSMAAMRGAIWAQRSGVIDAYDRALYVAAWADSRNVGDPDTLLAIVREADLDADAMAAAIQTAEIKQGLIDATNEAVERGVFGAPAMFVADEMHWGQDRLGWVERALAR